jgi:hypothetical protein
MGVMTRTLPIFDRLLEPVARALNSDAASQLLSLRADDATQARIDELADRCNEGTLSDGERAEYESLVAAGELISVLQAKARIALATPPAA